MTTISNKVRLYRYSDANAPVLSGTAGALIAILDACLVDGYDSKSINTLTVTGNNATAVISAGHTYEVGAVIRIAGATPTALNGDWRLASVTGTDAVFSVEGLGIAEGAATGTITALRAPAGWAKIYSDTNRAAYRSLDYADHNGMTLYVDDTNATYAQWRGYESMSDIDTGTGPFPTDAQLSGGCYVGKANNTTGTRNWALVADATRLCVMPCPNTGSNEYSANSPSFGRLVNEHDADIWAHTISGATSSSNALSTAIGSDVRGLHIASASVVNGSGVFMPRAINGAVGAIAASVRVPYNSATTGSSAYPSASLADKMWAEEGLVCEGASFGITPRGLFPGPAHLYAYVRAVSVGFDIVGVPGNGVMIVHSATANAYAINLGIDGRWD